MRFKLTTKVQVWIVSGTFISLYTSYIPQHPPTTLGTLYSIHILPMSVSNLAPYWQYHPSPYYLHMPHHHHLSSAQAHVGSGYVVSYLLPTTNKPLEYFVDVPNNSLPPVFLASLPLKKNNPRCPRIPQIPYTTFRLDTGHITRKASPHPSFAHFQEELPSVAHLSHLNPS